MIEGEDNGIEQEFVKWELFVELALDVPKGIAVDASLKALFLEKEPSWDFFGLLV